MGYNFYSMHLGVINSVQLTSILIEDKLTLI